MSSASSAEDSQRHVRAKLARDEGLAVAPVDVAEWADLASGFQDHNYRQSWAFARACAVRIGGTSEHLRIDRRGELIAACDVRIRRLAVIGGGIAYVNGGPLFRRHEVPDFGCLRDALSTLRSEFVDRRGLILRVAPSAVPEPWGDEVTAVFTEAGFVRASQPRYSTILLDIRPPLESLRAAMAQKWRNGLNGAERQGLEIESGESTRLIDEFAALFSTFREHKTFSLDLDALFYARVQEQALSGERFLVSLARKDGETVAGHVASCLGNTSVYLLGATLPSGLKAKAGYLLQWHAIQQARERGLTWYDLGGIDAVGNPGVYHFKKGLAGVEVTAPGPFEMASRHPAAVLTRLGERMYRALRARMSG